VGQLAFFTWQYSWSFRHDSKALPGELWRGDQPPGLIALPVHFFLFPEVKAALERNISGRRGHKEHVTTELYPVPFGAFDDFCAAFGKASKYVLQ